MDHHQAAAILASERYTLDELSAAEREAFEEHYFSCQVCAQDVRDLSVLKAGWKEVIAERSVAEQEKANEREAWKHGGFFQNWWMLPRFALAIPATLAVIVLVTSWYVIQKRQTMEPQVIASVMLRPESRGEVSTISPEQIGQFVLLECDVPFEAGNVAWQLRRNGAMGVERQGVAKAPEPGATFKLLIPSSVLERAEYILQIDAGGAESGPSKRSAMYRLKIK